MDFADCRSSPCLRLKLGSTLPQPARAIVPPIGPCRFRHEVVGSARGRQRREEPPWDAVTWSSRCSLDVAIAVHDELESNPVSYLLRVTPTTSARELARSFGTTQSGTVSTMMRIRYYKPPKRAVLLRLTVSDEVGNETSVRQVVKLPR